MVKNLDLEHNQDFFTPLHRTNHVVEPSNDARFKTANTTPTRRASGCASDNFIFFTDGRTGFEEAHTLPITWTNLEETIKVEPVKKLG